MTGYQRALAYATEAHAGQLRKGTDLPYIVHPTAVAESVLAHDGTETEAIAALLHDTVEDQGGRARLEDVRRRFGQRVAEIVEGCSEWVQEPHQTEADKPSWKERKRRVIEHYRTEHDRSVLLVALADKVNNAGAIVAELHNHGQWSWSASTPAEGTSSGTTPSWSRPSATMATRACTPSSSGW